MCVIETNVLAFVCRNFSDKNDDCICICHRYINKSMAITCYDLGKKMETHNTLKSLWKVFKLTYFCILLPLSKKWQKNAFLSVLVKIYIEISTTMSTQLNTITHRITYYSSTLLRLNAYTVYYGIMSLTTAIRWD